MTVFEAGMRALILTRDRPQFPGFEIKQVTGLHDAMTFQRGRFCSSNYGRSLLCPTSDMQTAGVLHSGVTVGFASGLRLRDAKAILSRGAPSIQSVKALK